MNRNSIQSQAHAVISKSQARKLRFGIVVAEFNGDITEKLFLSAQKTFIASGVLEKNIDTVHVPGGFEIPLACQRLAMARKKYAALIAIGCVIRGDTDHYVYIANESTRGTMDVMLKYSLPIANCILTLENLKQAQDRSGKEDNKGSEAALAALSMVNYK